MRFPARHKPPVLEPDCHKEALSSRQGPADFLLRIETFKFTCPMGNYLAHYTLYTLLLCCSVMAAMDLFDTIETSTVVK